MFKTCAFCNSKLDGDGGPSGLGVGKRLAFDEWKGRLWVICPKCSRWNLTPLDERLERIEALARAAREGRVAAATAQVALIRWHGYDFVRVGKPPRLEFATWRYGERLKARQREQLKVVVPLTVATVGLAGAGASAPKTRRAWSRAPGDRNDSSATSRGASSRCAASRPIGGSLWRWPWTSRRRSLGWSGSGARPKRSPKSRTDYFPRRRNW